MPTIQRRFRTVLTARLLLEYRDHWLFLQQTPKNGGGFTLPGGKIDGEEFAKDALVREVFEETNLLVSRKSMTLVHVAQRKLKSIIEIIFLFKSDEFTGEIQNKEPLNFDNTVWLPTDEPPKGLSPVIVYALRRMEKDKFYSEFPKVKKKEKEELLLKTQTERFLKIENEKPLKINKLEKVKAVKSEKNDKPPKLKSDKSKGNKKAKSKKQKEKPAVTTPPPPQ